VPSVPNRRNREIEAMLAARETLADPTQRRTDRKGNLCRHRYRRGAWTTAVVATILPSADDCGIEPNF